MFTCTAVSDYGVINIDGRPFNPRWCGVSGAVRGGRVLTIAGTRGLLLVGAKDSSATKNQTENIVHFE